MAAAAAMREDLRSAPSYKGENMRPNHPINILLVDDRPENLLALEAVLSDLGYNLVKAGSGEEALRCLLQDEFAMILLDVQMPGMDGFETAAQIRQREKLRNTPIIFITAIYQNESHILRGYAIGAVDYICKPFEADVLKAKVRAFADQFEKAQGERAALLARERVARAETEAAQQQVLNILEGMEGGFTAYDRQWRFTYLNSKAAQIVGKDKKDLLGAVVWEVFPELVGGESYKNFHEAMRTQKPVRYEQYSKVANLWLEINVYPTPDGLSVFSTDITDRKRVAEERARLLAREQAARKQAEAANRMKDEFLATVSHELRTPLTAILGWAEVLCSAQLDVATTARALEIIERNAKAQAQLVDDLLDVSRIISGKLRLDVRPVEPIPVIRAALDALRPAADAKEIRLEEVLDPTTGPLLGDASRLQQVVWNLLSNAIKFTPRGGHVQVRLARVGSHIEIKVQDTGPGIRPEFLPYVFERFRQDEVGTARKHGGLGLGLAIVRHLVELHGGTAHVDSPGEGQGAIFTVRLPVRPIRTEAETLESIYSTAEDKEIFFDSPISLAGVRVLLVDDEADALDFLTLVFTKCAAEVTAVGSAAQALEALKRSTVDVLISDIGMPDEDGYALIRQVRALPPEQGGAIPAVALTAYARTEDRLRVLSSGYQMHVPKPVEPIELVIVVSSLIRRTGRPD